MAQQNIDLLSQAIAHYIETQAGRNSQAVQQELGRFIRWCGRDRATSSLKPLEIEDYCTTLEGTGEESTKRLAVVKEFLGSLYRQGQTATNLASHAKMRRGGRKASASRRERQTVNVNRLTSDGYRQLQEELEALKTGRLVVAEELRLAAATKDFTENAPLDAAREHQGQLEARIRELEGTLKNATVQEEVSARKKTEAKIEMLSRFVLKHTQTGREVSYLLVESREADPAAGKLSAASPVGKAVLGRRVGEVVEVATPGGAVRYVIAKVGS